MVLHCGIQDERHSPELQQQLVEELWSPTGRENHLNDCCAYFKYYGEQCRQSLVDRGRHSLARTHEDIIKVARLIKQKKTYEEILWELKTSCDSSRQAATDEACKGTINLVARLVTMAMIGTLRYEISGQRHIEWNRGTLQECVSGWFSGPVLDSDNIKLEKLFNAANLAMVAGLRIVWTNNIADHLSLQNNDQEVLIFHHATFLKDHGL